jgi:hypothetical protein
MSVEDQAWSVLSDVVVEGMINNLRCSSPLRAGVKDDVGGDAVFT